MPEGSSIHIKQLEFYMMDFRENLPSKSSKYYINIQFWVKSDKNYTTHTIIYFPDRSL